MQRRLGLWQSEERFTRFIMSLESQAHSIFLCHPKCNCSLSSCNASSHPVLTQHPNVRRRNMGKRASLMFSLFILSIKFHLKSPWADVPSCLIDHTATLAAGEAGYVNTRICLQGRGTVSVKMKGWKMAGVRARLCVSHNFQHANMLCL